MLKPFVGALSLLLLAAGKVTAGKLSPTDTITWGGDNTRNGYQSTHNMDPSVVGSPQFGQLWKTDLPGNYRGFTEQLYAQSLVYTLNDGVQYVFVSTTQNNVYKINAKTGAIVASRNLHVPFLTADLDSCVDINPTVGVTATGVIDPDTDTWYLTAKTYLDQSDQIKGRLNGRYYFHAIDVNTLAEKPGFPKGLEGIVGSNNANRMFQGGNAHQRPALLHTGQYIYAGFASHCVQYNFTGWIMGWDKTSGAVVERFTTEGGPEANSIPGGGVWMSGGGIATDGKGSMYYSTGNGYTSQLSGTPVPGRQPPTALEEAAVNMKINDDGSLKVVDFFMPWEKVQLDGADKDLGTTPLELLQPDVFTCPNVKRMGIVTGKSGKTYILNLDDLGGYQQGPNKLDKVPQVIQNENSVYAGAGVYPLEGGYVYINVIQYPTHVFKFSCDASGNPSFTKVGDSPEKNAYILGVGHGTTTSLNGQKGTGLLWVSDVDGYNLRVYNAVPVNGQLQLIKTANVVGITKFTRPVFGDGRAYVGTVQGALYCFGSPVNLPLTCTSPNDFGSAVINSTSAAKTIQCQANVDTHVTSITIKSPNFQVSSLPALPFSLTNGQNISFQAVFSPSAPGPLSNDVLLAVTNDAPGFSTSVPVSLKGIGDSLAPLLAVTPNVVAFEGVITGQEAGGRDQSIIFENQGDSVLTVKGLDYSVLSETGALVTPNNTANGPQVGPFTFKGLPTTIAANSQVVVNVNFNPTDSGNFAVYVHVRTDGGTKIFDVVGTAGTYPVAVLEFQAADGSGKWIPYTNNSPPFTFGNVFEQHTKVLKMRLTNNGSSSAASLSVTVSKPPFGVSGIVGAQNGVDLAEGTVLAAGNSSTADLYCSVPKSQVNTDSYNGSTVWTMNTGDPNFGKQFIQFTCTAVAEQVGPLYPNGSAIYRYDGCWKENNPGRQLKVQLWGKNPGNTNGNCISACSDKGYTYAGTQYVDECWCSNRIPSSQSNETDCNYACSGDDTETCGGNGYFHDGAFISLFTNKPGVDDPTPPAPPAVVKSVGNYNYTACYTEGSGARALGAKNTASDDMTLEKCAAFCTGYTYFGIEYASECYCDNIIGGGSAPTSESQCSMTCSGNDTQICGGGNRLTLYTLNQTGKSSSVSPSASGSSASTASSISSSASPSATGPVAVPTAGAFAYQGCYTEGTNARALAATATASGDMTVEKCATFCAGYSYMGVEYSSECYCANTISSGAALASDGCSMTCGGNPNEFCGGGGRLNLYKTGATSSTSVSGTVTSAASTSSVASSTGPAAVPTAGVFAYQGCYTEGTNARALAGTATASGDMTVEKCAAFCAGYTYMGVEYSSECYCANTISSGAVLASDGCSMTCGGNPNEFCGGGGRLNLYKTGAASSSTSSKASVLSTVTSAASTSSVASSTGPAAVPTAGVFAYQGCYTEGTNARALAAAATASGDMTVEKCAAFCAGYTYMGVEYSSECYCAKTISSGAVLTSDGCAMTCGGNPNEFCGGGGRLNLYKAGAASSSTSSKASVLSTVTSAASTSSAASSTGPAAVPTAGVFAYQGCYTEGTNARALAGTATASGDMTVEKCAAFCAGYTYMGVEYSSECYCANTISSGAILASDGCSMTCGGNPNEFCGGGGRLNLYKAGAASSSTSSNSGSSTVTSAASSSTSSKASVSSTVTSSASTSSVASSTGPAAVPTAGVFAYQGCYTEGTNARALAAAATASGDMTVEKCAAFCAGYTYMGVEYSSECFCANTISSGAVLTSDGCSMTCGGNPNEFCGGGNRLNLYKAGVTVSSTSSKLSVSNIATSAASTTAVTSSTVSLTPSSTPSGPSAVTTAGGFSYAGCYSEGTNGRALSDKATVANGLTVEQCATFCSGYTYMGVEYSTECYCGNTIGAGAVLVGNGCTMTCGGNANEYCGGPNRLNFYKVGSSSSSALSSTATTSSASFSSTTTASTSSPSSSFTTATSTGSNSSSSSAAGSTSSGTAKSAGSSSSSSSVAASTSSATATPTGSNSSSSSVAGSTSSSTATSTGSSSSSSSAAGSTSSVTAKSTGSVSSSSSVAITRSSSTITSIGSNSSSAPSSVTTTTSSGSVTSSTTATLSTSSSSSSSSPATSTPVSKSSAAADSSTAVSASTSSKSSSSISTVSTGSTSSTSSSTGKSTGSSSTAPPSSTPTGPVVFQGNVNFTYTACYVDSGPRALSNLVLASDQLTAELCLQACSQYTYAGLEYGRECWCDNTLASSATQATAESECNKKCAGNSSEICGAGNRLTLYTHNAQFRPKAAFAVQAVPDSNSVSQSSSLSSVSQSSSVLPSLSATSSGFITSSKPSTSASTSSLSSTSQSQSVTKSTSQVSSSSTLSGSTTFKSSSSVSISSSTEPSTSLLSSTISKSSIASSNAVSSSKPSSSLSSLTTSKSSTLSSISLSSISLSPSSFITSTKSSSTSTTSKSSSATSSISSTSSPSFSLTSATSISSSSSMTSATSSKSISSISTTSSIFTPAPTQIVKDWVYLGCANQTSPPALSGMMKSAPGQMTIEICQDYCIHNYYGLAAVENGDTCSCGNGLQSYSALGQNSCNTPCAGNSSETCGGKDPQGNTYLSVWNSTSKAIIPTFVKQVGAYPRLGCYTNSDKQALSAVSYSNATGMSAESCVGYCITKDYAYAGLSDANTCFCDSKLATTSTLWDDVRCTKTCSGNSREFCGGEKGILVYKRDESSVVNGKPKALNEDNTPLG